MVYRVGIARIERVWKGPAGVGQYQVRSNIAVPGTLTASAPQHRVGRPCTDFAVVDVDPKIIARLVELAVEVAKHDKMLVGARPCIDPFLQDSPLPHQELALPPFVLIAETAIGATRFQVEREQMQRCSDTIDRFE
jgi:hypothetical protein